MQALKAQFKIFHQKLIPKLFGWGYSSPTQALSLDNQRDAIETNQHFRFSLLGTEIVYVCVCVVVGGELQHNKYPKISDVSCQVNNMICFPQHFFYTKTFSALSLSFPHPFLLLFFYVFPCPSCARGSKSDRELIFRTHV